MTAINIKTLSIMYLLPRSCWICSPSFRVAITNTNVPMDIYTQTDQSITIGKKPDSGATTNPSEDAPEPARAVGVRSIIVANERRDRKTTIAADTAPSNVVK